MTLDSLHALYTAQNSISAPALIRPNQTSPVRSDLSQSQYRPHHQFPRPHMPSQTASRIASLPHVNTIPPHTNRVLHPRNTINLNLVDRHPSQPLMPYWQMTKPAAPDTSPADDPTNPDISCAAWLSQGLTAKMTDYRHHHMPQSSESPSK